jgi:hypothetical protein
LPLVAGSISVAPQSACPAQAVVAAAVDRLGARRTLEQVGAAEANQPDQPERLAVLPASSGPTAERPHVDVRSHRFVAG